MNKNLRNNSFFLKYLYHVCKNCLIFIIELIFIKRETRHFAKRQITWFKRERQVEWFDKQEFGYDSQAILDAMLASLREKKIIE